MPRGGRALLPLGRYSRALHLAARLCSLELQIPGSQARRPEVSCPTLATVRGGGRRREIQTWRRRNMEGRGAGPGRAVCECQKRRRRVQRWCQQSGARRSWSWERLGRGAGAGPARQGPAGHCSGGARALSPDSCGRSNAVSSQTSPTSVLTKRFLSYSQVLGLGGWENVGGLDGPRKFSSY